MKQTARAAPALRSRVCENILPCAWQRQAAFSTHAEAHRLRTRAGQSRRAGTTGPRLSVIDPRFRIGSGMTDPKI